MQGPVGVQLVCVYIALKKCMDVNEVYVKRFRFYLFFVLKTLQKKKKIVFSSLAYACIDICIYA